MEFWHQFRLLVRISLAWLFHDTFADYLSSNLGSLANSSICVSNPMGDYSLAGMTQIITTTAFVHELNILDDRQ